MFKLKKYFFKNVIKCISVFFISIILSGFFTVKVSGLKIEDLQGDLKKLYDSLTPQAQEKFEEFFLPIYSSLDEQNQKNFDKLLLSSCVSLFQIYQRNKISFNFTNFLDSIINFLDSIENPTTKQHVAFLMGICPIKENGEVVGFLVASRKMVNFTTKCKSSINGLFHKLNYSALKSKFETSKIFADYFCRLKLNSGERRQWSVRIKRKGNSDMVQLVDKTLPNFPGSNGAAGEFEPMSSMDNFPFLSQGNEMVEEFNPMDPSTYLKNTPNNNNFSADKILDYSNFGPTPLNGFNCEENNKEDFQFSLDLRQNLI